MSCCLVILLIASGALPAAPPRGRPELLIELNHSDFGVNEPVRLREMIPVDSGHEFTTISHEIARLKAFNFVGRLTDDLQLSLREFDSLDPFVYFPGLSSSSQTFPIVPLQAVAADGKGVECNFRAKVPGVYLLKTTWGLRTLTDPVTGPPVVFTVRMKKEPGPTAPEITLRLDRAVITAGDEVRLRESVPVGLAGRFSALEHEIVQIGRFDRFGQLSETYLPSLLSERPTGLLTLAGLPARLRSASWLSLDVTEAGYKGVEFKFRPDVAGVYLIQPSRASLDVPGPVQGIPVVLTVRPKKNEK